MLNFRARSLLRCAGLRSPPAAIAGSQFLQMDGQHLLETFKCRDFFCLENEKSLLYNLKVPVDGFDLLLEVVSIFDFMDDHDIMFTIKQNMPIDYNLEKPHLTLSLE